MSNLYFPWVGFALECDSRLFQLYSNMFPYPPTTLGVSQNAQKRKAVNNQEHTARIAASRLTLRWEFNEKKTHPQ